MNKEEIYNTLYNNLRSFIEDNFRNIIPQCGMGKYTDKIIRENMGEIHRESEYFASDITEKFLQILDEFYIDDLEEGEE